MTRICQIRGGGSDPIDDVESGTLGALLRLIESRLAFNNIFLRHYVFCILQVLAGRQPTLYGISRGGIKSYAETCSELKKLFAACIEETKAMGTTDMDIPIHLDQDLMMNMEMFSHPDFNTFNIPESSAPPPSNVIDHPESSVPPLPPPNVLLNQPESESSVPLAPPNVLLDHPESSVPLAPPNVLLDHPESSVPPPHVLLDHNNMEDETPNLPNVEPLADNPIDPPHEVKTETDATVSNSQERRKPVLKFRVKRSNKAEEGDIATAEKADRGGASSSVSVDAPHNVNVEEVNSCHDPGSRVTASIGSAKIVSEGDEVRKELQCTAESSKVVRLPPPSSSPSMSNKGIVKVQKYVSLNTLNVPIQDDESQKKEKEREKKNKKKEKRRRREERGGGHSEDPEYLERKRLKKEKKMKEKEIQQLLGKKEKSENEFAPPETVAAETIPPRPPPAVVVPPAQMPETRAGGGTETAPPSHKIRIKLKSRTTQ